MVFYVLKKMPWKGSEQFIQVFYPVFDVLNVFNVIFGLLANFQVIMTSSQCLRRSSNSTRQRDECLILLDELVDNLNKYLR